MSSIDKLSNRTKSIAAKCLIGEVDDSGDIQVVKISALDNETDSGIDRIQNYGVTSNPPDGSEAIVLRLGGNRDNQIVIVTDSGEHRITSLSSGEVCVYSQHGQKILLDENGDIVESTTGGQKKFDSSGVLTVGAGTDDIATASTIDAYFTVIDEMLTVLDALAGGIYASKMSLQGLVPGAIPSVAATNAKANKTVIP